MNRMLSYVLHVVEMGRPITQSKIFIWMSISTQRLWTYSFVSPIPALDLAYATTIHQLQGSESETVAMPVLSQHFRGVCLAVAEQAMDP